MAATSAEANKPWSVPALITFILLAIWSGMVGGVFYLVINKVDVGTVMFGLLSGIFVIEQSLLVGAVGFWMGSSIGAKAAGDAMADSSKAGQLALAQIAGAGTGDGRETK